MVNELDCGGRELGVVLEDSAVARVRVDGEFRASDPTVHVFGEGGGDHAIVVAIRDQCRLGDNGQVGRRWTGPVSPKNY
jgi:hypothetical protein